MHIESPLNIALDEYAGLCAVGHLSNLKAELFGDPGVAAFRLSGATYWKPVAYNLAIWQGNEDGSAPPDGDPEIWVQFQDQTFKLSDGLLEAEIRRTAPSEFLNELLDTCNQLIAIYSAALDAISAATTREDTQAVLNELARIASEAKGALDYEGDALLAESDLMFNCAITLLEGITVKEVEPPHLSYEIMADTLDPATNAKVKIAVGWVLRPGEQNGYTHSYIIGDASCLAHDQPDIDRLMATVHPEARAHYLHAFDHLHQVAHAASDLSAAKIGHAIAEASTWQAPLDAFERHEIAHRVHRESLEQLNTTAWTFSERDIPPSHRH